MGPTVREALVNRIAQLTPAERDQLVEAASGKAVKLPPTLGAVRTMVVFEFEEAGAVVRVDVPPDQFKQLYIDGCKARVESGKKTRTTSP